MLVFGAIKLNNFIDVLAPQEQDQAESDGASFRIDNQYFPWNLSCRIPSTIEQTMLLEIAEINKAAAVHRVPTAKWLLS